MSEATKLRRSREQVVRQVELLLPSLYLSSIAKFVVAGGCHSGNRRLELDLSCSLGQVLLVSLDLWGFAYLQLGGRWCWRLSVRRETVSRR